MKKNLPLYVLLIFLIIVNGFFLYNYMGLGSDEKQNKAKKPQDFLLKELNFDESQIEQYKNQNADFLENTVLMAVSIRHLKDQLFSNLSADEVNELEIDSIASLIGDKEKEKEVKAFYYFKSIYDICNDKQKKKFSEIIKDALRRGDKSNRPPPQNRRGGEHQGPPSMEGGEHRPPPMEGVGHRPPPEHH